VLAAVGLGGSSAGGGAAGAAAGAAAVGPLSTATLAKVAVIGALAGGGVVAGDSLVGQSEPSRAPAPATGQPGENGGRPVSPAHSTPTAVAPGHAKSPPARSRRGRRRHSRDGKASRPGQSLPSSINAGPKPVPPRSHANPPGRPAPTRPPVRRRVGHRKRPQGANGTAPARAKPKPTAPRQQKRAKKVKTK
jgi:hypothetical protein